VCTEKIDNFFLPRAKGPCYKAGPALDKENLFVCLAKENITSEEILYRSTVLANKGGLPGREINV
jgi:hypothetical protein